jgi:tellurite resistance protein TerC
MELTTVATPSLWIVFTGLVITLLAIDLGVLHRTVREVRMREAILWSLVWVALALTFNAWVYHRFGEERGLEFLTGYVIEKALAVDNLFVFLVVFTTFAVPKALRHRVLFWGVLGALVMRAGFILAGAAMISRFHWILYLFGAFLLVTGIKLLREGDIEMRPELNPVFRLFRRLVPSVTDYHRGRFTVRKGGKRYATPLLLVLVCIEIADVIFAVDSIPAIFAVTTDPFIVYTSNICAILGLRAMFFVVAGAVEQIRFLKVGLSLVLSFVGIKMLIVDFYKIPIGWSLFTITAILAVSVLASWLLPAGEPPGSDGDNLQTAISP